MPGAAQSGGAGTVPPRPAPLGACRRWGDDSWRADPLGGGASAGSDSGGGDSRTARHETPQYQTEDDARRAAERLGEEVACVACAVFDG